MKQRTFLTAMLLGTAALLGMLISQTTRSLEANPQPGETWGMPNDGNPFERPPRVHVIATQGRWVQYKFSAEATSKFSLDKQTFKRVYDKLTTKETP